MSLHCTDTVVGDILAGWRYDISGITPEMRGDYEDHLATCLYCRRKQRLHRTIDIGLIVLSSVSAVMFLLAWGAIRHFDPRHAFLLEIAALAGFAVSSVVWLVVAVTTPAPLVLADVARSGARRVQERLPEEIRNRLPEEIRNL